MDDQTTTRSTLSKYLRSPAATWVILAAALALTAAAWFVTRQTVQHSAEQRFDARTAELETAIEDRMIVYEQVLWGGVGLFNASDFVSREDWNRYVATLELETKRPGIQGMGFAVPLQPDELDDHVASIRAEGFPDYELRQERPRDEYTSIIYLEPFDDRNRRAFGYDMFSNDLRREAMTAARDTGLAATSGAITLVQETDDDVQRGFLTYVPVYATPTVPPTPTEREEQLQGWVYAAFRVGDLMEGILGADGNGVDYEIFDGAEINQEALLFSSLDATSDDLSEEFEFSSTSILTLQGREWLISFHVGSSFIDQAEARQPTYIAFAGIIIVALLFGVMTSQRRARSRAENMASQLRATKQDLEVQAIELQHQAQQLVRSNEELDQFARAASHDLQEPLRTMGNYSALLSSKYEDELGPEGTRWLGYITTSSVRMSSLLRELLGYASLDGEEPKLSPIDLDDALTAALNDLTAVIEEANVEIIRQPLPTVLGNEFQIERLFLNLVGNAIKYRADDRDTKVWINVLGVEDGWRIGIRDNGIGIKAEYHQRVFEMFRRVGVRSKYQGTGIGLAVCAKIVESHGGQIGVTSVPGVGSTFWFTVQKVDQPSTDVDLRTNAPTKALAAN